MDKILRKKRYIILFVAPALILYIIFGLIPDVYKRQPEGFCEKAGVFLKTVTGEFEEAVTGGLQEVENEVF